MTIIKPKTGGFPPWTEDEIAAYERRWPLGTRQRVWLDVLLYTGLRRGDAARLGRQHVKNGVATLTTEKKKIVVSLPILPVLQKTLDAGPCCDLAFISSAHGKPFTKESFGNAFGEAARIAGDGHFVGVAPSRNQFNSNRWRTSLNRVCKVFQMC
jgi:integrase